MNDISNDLYNRFGERINDVYKSPILDISVDMKKETNGYLPGVKRMYSEHLFYDGCCHRDSRKYEDRGVKHLYEFHHCCSSSSGYCNSFCNVKLTEGNHKLNDVFHVENEEMVCLDSAVNYNKLHDFHVENAKIDKEQKKFAYSTLIPPPCVAGIKGRRVYVTEVNVDLSTDFLSPHTIQDPTYVCYDEDVLALKLNKPVLEICDGFKGSLHRQCLMDLLNGIMKDYRSKESSYNFNTLKYNLKAVCNASTELFFDGQNLYFEHFILDVVMHCLRHAMKMINDKLVLMTGHRSFRQIFHQV